MQEVADVPVAVEAVAYSELNPVFVEQQAQAAVPPEPEEVEVEVVVDAPEAAS